MPTDDDFESALNEGPPVDALEVDRLRDRIGTTLFGNAPRPPLRLGKYRLGRRIGAGAMGEVYEAFDDVLERKVALKLLRAERVSPASTARMLQEAKSLARLDHPNVVRVYEVGLAEDRTWIAMQFVDGCTLREWLAAELRTRREILDVLAAAGRGLLAAHEAGLVHRDFKPDNVLVGDDGVARVADFGLVRMFASTEASPPSSTDPLIPEDARDAMEQGLTREGAMMGTPAYMSPEQLDGNPSGPRSDQFAFCVTCWEALLGQRPFEGGTVIALRRAIVDEGPRRLPRRHRVPRPLLRALRRGISSRSADRFESLLPVLTALEPPKYGRGTALGGGVVLAGLIAVLALSRREHAACEELTTLDRADLVETLEDLQQSYASTPLVYAQHTGADVAERLSAYGDAWLDARDVVCGSESAVAGDLVPVRATCLEYGRLALDVTLQELRVPDSSVIERAADSVASLPVVAECLVETTDSAFGGPSSDELMRETLEARAATSMGDPGKAETLSTSTIDAARARTDAWAEVEALRVRAQARLQLGRHDEAVEDLLAATDVTTLRSLDAKSIELWMQLAWIGASDLRDRDLAEEWLDRARAWVRRTGKAPEAGALELAEARVLELSDLEAALRMFDEVLAEVPPDSALARQARPARAGAAVRLGRFEEAAAGYRLMLDEASRRYGPEHPATARALYNVGLALDRTGSPDAGDYYASALEVWIRLHPDGNTDIVDAHVGLGNVRLKAGQPARALQHAETALEISDRLLGPNDTRMGEVRTLSGAVAHAMGRYDDAAVEHAKAVEVYKARLGPEHHNTAIAWSNLGEALLHQGRLEEAQRAFETAAVTLTRALGADSPYLAYPNKGLGLVALASGRREEAVAHLEKGREQIGSVDPIELLEIECALAWAATDGSEIQPALLDVFRRRADAIGPAARRRVDAVQRLLRPASGAPSRP